MKAAKLGAWTGLAGILAAICLTGAGGAAGTDAKRVQTDELGGRERFLAHASTDKPIYRARETVYVRGVVLNAADHTPAAQAGSGRLEIIGPKGNTVAQVLAPAEDSVAGFAWQVPEGQAGGQYRARVSFPELGIAPAERCFDIRAFRAPRLRTQIRFLRDGHGPGDQVVATLEATRAEGGVPANAAVTITARVDGQEIHRSTALIDRAGICEARFALPARMERGEGTLAFAVEDGGVVETAAKTIPILLQTVDLSLYPEGGDLVAGLPNRVYFEARTPAQKPADIAGVVVDADGRQAGSFRSEHEGRGRFTFRPAAGGRYALKITEPSGIDRTFPLPDVKDRGALVRSAREVYPAGKPISLQVLTTLAGPLTVTLSKREAELAARDIGGARAEGEETIRDVELTVPRGTDGVLIATVWDGARRPLAERLIFREPADRVTVTVETDRPRYAPGGKVNLSLRTTGADGKPLGAVVGLTVTDDSILEMIEKREQAPRLPVMVLLESDVRELADAHVYLDASNPAAPLAVDLLLGTQGWRRFALVDAAGFLGRHGDAARRALAMRAITRQDAKTDGGFLRALRFKGVGAMRGDVAVDAVAAGVAPPPAAVQEGGLPPPEAPPADMPVAIELPKASPAPSVTAPPRATAELVAAAEEAQARESLRRIAADEDVGMQWVSVRVYAHAARPERKPGDRVDFTETLYWHAGVKTDARTGEASVAFDLNDAVTSFRVFADAFSAGGALGDGTAAVESVQPFYVEPKLPLEVSMGDRVLAPLAVVNGTTETLKGARVEFQCARGISAGAVEAFDVGADARVRRTVELAVGDVRGEMDFVLSARAGPFADRVTRKLSVVSRGFPVQIAHGGILEPGSGLDFAIDIPASRVPGSVSSAIAVYPTPLANLTEALEALIREPCGCFEQTSSTTYPLVMAQQYFLSHSGVDPKLIERSRELLQRGYDRLRGFECKQRGYEWFGEDPGHEALTAFGLMEFSDMAAVHNVDGQMVGRTREWLLGARDGQGGFKRERRALHTWIADADCSNGYILWALLESGEKAASLKTEIEAFKAAAGKASNSYVLALAANVAHLGGDAAAARAFMDRLRAAQQKDGRVSGGTTTIVGSAGLALDVETTALATLAWLREPACAGAAEAAIRWLAESCKAGSYGSTQSTVLALRAIVAHDKARARPKAPGSLQLTIDGHPAGSPVEFDEKTQGAIELTDIAEMLEPGRHTVRLAMTGGSPMPFSLAVNYAAVTPASAEGCKVALQTALNDAELTEGEATEVQVVMRNTAGEDVPMPVAIVGIPGGLEVRHDQLKELVKAGRIASYEVLGRDVVLYWRSLAPGREVRLPVSVLAAIPGSYAGPASRAYLYYANEFKHWVEPLRVTVAPR